MKLIKKRINDSIKDITKIIIKISIITGSKNTNKAIITAHVSIVVNSNLPISIDIRSNAIKIIISVSMEYLKKRAKALC